jgi:hypothetical protein
MVHSLELYWSAEYTVPRQDGVRLPVSDSTGILEIVFVLPEGRRKAEGVRILYPMIVAEEREQLKVVQVERYNVRMFTKHDQRHLRRVTAYIPTSGFEWPKCWLMGWYTSSNKSDLVYGAQP